MSLNQLIENIQKPWLNIRVNDLVVDGTLIIEDSGVIPGTYGSSTETPIVTVNSSGLITNITETTIAPSNQAWVMGNTNLQTIIHNAPSAPIEFDVTITNTPAWYNTVQNSFTIPANNPGLYQFSLTVSLLSQATNLTNFDCEIELVEPPGTQLELFKIPTRTITQAVRYTYSFSTIIPISNATKTIQFKIGQANTENGDIDIVGNAGGALTSKYSVVRLSSVIV